MILPNKYESIITNSYVVGANIIKIFLETEEIEINNLYKKLGSDISLIKFYDVLTFLYFLDIISMDNNKISLRNVLK